MGKAQKMMRSRRLDTRYVSQEVLDSTQRALKRVGGHIRKRGEKKIDIRVPIASIPEFNRSVDWCSKCNKMRFEHVKDQCMYLPSKFTIINPSFTSVLKVSP